MGATPMERASVRREFHLDYTSEAGCSDQSWNMIAMNRQLHS